MEDAQPAGHELLAAQMGRLRKMVLLLLVASLAISVCLNLYVVTENRIVKQTFLRVEQERQSYMELSRFTQRLMMDLQALAKTDKAAQELIDKYKYATDPFGGQ